MAFLVSRKPWDCRLAGSGVKTHCLLHARWRQENEEGAFWSLDRSAVDWIQNSKHLFAKESYSSIAIQSKLSFLVSTVLFCSCRGFARNASGCRAFCDFLSCGALKWYLPLWTGSRFSTASEALIAGTWNLEMVSPHPTPHFCIKVHLLSIEEYCKEWERWREMRNSDTGAAACPLGTPLLSTALHTVFSEHVNNTLSHIILHFHKELCTELYTFTQNSAHFKLLRHSAVCIVHNTPLC